MAFGHRDRQHRGGPVALVGIPIFLANMMLPASRHQIERAVDLAAAANVGWQSGDYRATAQFLPVALNLRGERCRRRGRYRGLLRTGRGGRQRPERKWTLCSAAVFWNGRGRSSEDPSSPELNGLF